MKFKNKVTFRHAGLSQVKANNLKALIASDFRFEYIPFGLGKRDVHYKLVDLCKCTKTVCLSNPHKKNYLWA